MLSLTCTLAPAQDDSSKKRTRKFPPEGPPAAAAASGDARTSKRARVAAAAADDVDERFAQFMSVMQPRSKKKGENADLGAAASMTSGAREGKKSSEDEDDEEMQTFGGDETRAASAEEAENSLDDDDDGDEGGGDRAAGGWRANDNAANDESISDMEYLMRRTRRTLPGDEGQPDDDQEHEDEGRERAAVASASASAGPSRQRHEDIKEPARDMLDESFTRVFVRNLPFSTTPSELHDFFSQFATVTEVHLPRGAKDDAPTGLGYVRFENHDEANKARSKTDGRPFQGRLVHVLPAADRASRNGGAADGGAVENENTKGWKDARAAAKKKASASAKGGLDWGVFYMSQDAVVSSISDRLGVSKAAIVEHENDDGGDGKSIDPAVRVALAEAHVINETKRYLEAQGMNVAAFANSPLKSARSATTILLKNIPYGTTTGQIASMLSDSSAVKRAIMPPAGTLAVLELKDKEAMQAAWRELAYKKIGNSILYVEKAPEAVWDAHLPQPGASAASTGNATRQQGEEETATTVGEGSTLYVKNLSFSTTTAQLASAFASLPGFAFARVQTKPDPRRGPGHTLSMGFGFVGFRDAQSASRALRTVDGFTLDAHKLIASFAQRGRDSGGDQTEGKKQQLKAGKSEHNAKLLVKNVPFEASKKDLRALFGAYGQVKSVRLPQKLERQRATRGFAFVEFVSRKEAEHAFEALQHVHLLGRHLVLQWAKLSDDGGADD